MAFQQPTRPAAQRAVRPTVADDLAVATQARPSSSERQPEESQSWVLFSPPTETSTTSYITESEHSRETPGRSRLSDLGSRDSVALSGELSNVLQSASGVSATEDHAADEDAELDSLDSHLPEFRSVPGLQTLSFRSSAATGHVFPSHDGLGSFRLDRPVFGAEAQERIYQFEQFNPRKFRRRLDSFDYGQHETEHTHIHTQEDEKRQRIEAWRLEHSRILLDEVQRETRRRRKSMSSMYRSRRSTEAESDNMTWHDEDAIDTSDNHDEGFLARITRKVVKDLLGIDDHLLSILLGEETTEELESLSSTPRASQMSNLPLLAHDESSWQLRILENLSRELGLLVHQLSPHPHPGAFTTYTRLQQMPLPYAGLPAIPEASDGLATPETGPDRPSGSLPEFRPTIPMQTQPMEIPGRRHEGDSAIREADVDEGCFTKDEWEKGLDIKLVFRYLVSRFTSRSSNSPPPSTSQLGTPTVQDNAAKVARVRQHHPLIARARPVERRVFRAGTPGSPVVMRHHSSCASQSTRRSARRSSCSSRHYWDIGGSLGTGSVIASNGPMGSWGEI